MVFYELVKIISIIFKVNDFIKAFFNHKMTKCSSVILIIFICSQFRYLFFYSIVKFHLFGFFLMTPNGCVYETFGTSKHFPVKLQVLLIRAKMLDNTLTAKCFIYDVNGWFLIISYFLF